MGDLTLLIPEASLLAMILASFVTAIFAEKARTAWLVGTGRRYGRCGRFHLRIGV